VLPYRLCPLIVLSLACSSQEATPKNNHTESPTEPAAKPAVSDPPPASEKDASPAKSEPVTKRKTPPPLENPLKIVGHKLRNQASIACFDPFNAIPRWSVSVTLDAARPCPESGSEVPLVVFSIGDQREESKVALPQPGSKSLERLYLFQYKKAPDSFASIDEIRGESQDPIMVNVEVLRHDPPYVIVHLTPEKGSKLPKGIKEFGGELSILLSPASEPYADPGSWKIE
jgi:hypothetical protein